MMYEFQGPVLFKMSREEVIMLVVENTKMEVIGVRDIDAIIKMEEAISELTDE